MAASLRRDIHRLPLPPPEKLVLLILAEYNSPPQAELAEYFRISPRRVRQLLADLLDREYVRVHRCRRRAYYTVADLGRIRACVE